MNRTGSRTVWIVAGTFTFLALLTAAALLDRLPTAVAVVYIIVSLIAFTVYGIDKSAAQNGRWRTPESTLHLLALAGGWPGALAAQTLLRHKTRKVSFQIVFWGTVLINAAGLTWLWTRWNVGV